MATELQPQSLLTGVAQVVLAGVEQLLPRRASRRVRGAGVPQLLEATAPQLGAAVAQHGAGAGVLHGAGAGVLQALRRLKRRPRAGRAHGSQLLAVPHEPQSLTVVAAVPQPTQP